MLEVYELLERTSTSLSLLILFAVLHFYKYEVMYKWLLAIVAVAGMWFPVLFCAPYFLILWRVFIGKNVTTERKMFIGERKSRNARDSVGIDESSDTLAHWMVAVETEEMETFRYTHAVGRVVSGQGEKQPFVRKSADELKQKYSLTHVGYVTRRSTEQRMEEVVELEPMKSGNSCQEFAVDIAFQLSSSRTYTFIKTMGIIRVRTFAFYLLFAVSLIAYVIDIHWLAKVFNVVVICNLFVALELSRIGYLNTRVQHGILPVLKAYIRYPTSWNFLQLFLISLILFVLHYKLGLIVTAAIGFVLMILIIST